MIASQTDRFLSEEDLDIQNMTWAELMAWWNLWLEQAQIANELDRDEYSHGVFRYGPPTDGDKSDVRRQQKQTRTPNEEYGTHSP